MASIHNLSNEVLLRIFSHFKTFELFNLDQVSRNWNSLIKESVWNHITRVDENIIDYPFGNFVENFIEISRRVENVNELLVDLSELRLRADQQLGQLLKNATIDLLKKLSVSAVLPLDMVRDVLLMEYPGMLFHDDHPSSVSEATAAISSLSRQLKVHEFNAVKVKKIFFARLEFGRNPFLVSCYNTELPLPLNPERVTHLYIECLVASTTSKSKDGVAAVQALLSRILNFPQLETIELDQLEFLMPTPSEKDFFVDMTLKFRRHRGQFSHDRFVSFLTALGDINGEIRSKKIVSLIDEWKNNNVIECCEIVIRSSKFADLASTLSRRVSVQEGAIDDADATTMILNRIFPSLTSKLQLIVYDKDDCEELLITSLQQHGVFDRLKALTVCFDKESDGDSEDPNEAVARWDVFEGVRRARKILRYLRNSIGNLNYLELDFSMGGDCCLRSMFTPIEVVGPLPHLRELVYHDLVCFPFLISAVKGAPDLRSLTVKCCQFEDERAGVEWMKKLFDALESSHHLVSLLFTVNGAEPNSEQASGRVKLYGQLKPDKEDDRALLSAIDIQLNNLSATLPALRKISVTIETCSFQFVR